MASAVLPNEPEHLLLSVVTLCPTMLEELPCLFLSAFTHINWFAMGKSFYSPDSDRSYD